MNNRKAGKASACAGFLLLCCFLTGCSVSFCGFRIGNQEELVFTCEEELPKQRQSADREAQEALREIPGETASAETDEQDQQDPEEASDGKVNLNTAGLEELMTLKGIGETRAKAIIEYRAQNGSFTKTEDIMQIPGIKEGIFSRIRDQITVD